MLEKLISYFEPQEDVLGLLLFGSLSKSEFQPDYWSDIDILIVVKDNQLDKFFPTVDWTEFFGKLYTFEQSSDDFKCTTRVCYENFNRIDFVFTTEAKLVRVDEWPSNPFSTGIKTMFSRSIIVDQIAGRGNHQPKISSVTEEQFAELVRKFRFKSMLAVYKVVRDDLLIALHLAQDLIRDCCVLGMMLRDRETGTNIHKHGGTWNQLVEQLGSAQKRFTPQGILASIEASNQVFEKLACEWSSEYRENRHLLLSWIEKAKLELQESAKAPHRLMKKPSEKEETPPE